jgi:hypothetical protein
MRLKPVESFSMAQAMRRPSSSSMQRSFVSPVFLPTMTEQLRVAPRRSRR